MESNETQNREPRKQARFAINSDGTIASGMEVIQDGAAQFQSARGLEKLAQGWPPSQLVQVWNQLPGVKPIKKFRDRKTAASRIWKAMEQLYGATTALEPVTTRRRSHEVEISPAPETKTDKILDLLRQPSGATLKMLMAATGWQAHTIRGFLSRHIRKKLGLRIKSFRRGGERVYVVRRKQV